MHPVFLRWLQVQVSVASAPKMFFAKISDIQAGRFTIRRRKKAGSRRASDHVHMLISIPRKCSVAPIIDYEGEEFDLDREECRTQDAEFSRPQILAEDILSRPLDGKRLGNLTASRNERAALTLAIRKSCVKI